MNSGADEAKPRKSRLHGSGAGAGAGGGTLLVLLANNLPPGNQWKPWLVLIAPSLTIGISALWSWLRRKIESLLAERAFLAWIEKAKGQLQGAMQNPLTSEGHKAELAREMEKLESLAVQTAMRKAGRLAVIVSK